MTPAEAQRLLTIAAAFDNRRPDEDAAHAWAVALGGLPFDDCRLAVIEHYRHSTAWLMPATVRGIVMRTRGGRISSFGTLPDPPDGFDPDDVAGYLRWLRGTLRAIADGMEPGAPELGSRGGDGDCGPL